MDFIHGKKRDQRRFELGKHADSWAGGEERTRGPRGEGPQNGWVQRRGKMSSFHDAPKRKISMHVLVIVKLEKNIYIIVYIKNLCT